jgi:Diacylglycerol kinase catalytic domain
MIALLSNPNSTGNRAHLPRIRAFCANHPEIFHYEVEESDQIGAALVAIARIKPTLLVVNGGDGTVQATLTELNHGGHFGTSPPPVAVLPNGKTNLIALDLGVSGNPIVALKRMTEIADGDLSAHVVDRALISLTEGEFGNRPVLGMFLGGAGLADTILYCRHTIYPLGLPNGISHVVAGIAVFFCLLFKVRGKHLPPAPHPLRVSLIRDGVESRRFAFLIVTTLERLLFGGKTGADGQVGMKLLAVEQSTRSLIRALIASIFGRLGQKQVEGVHVERGDTIRIESDSASVILDGETFRASAGRPIVLRSSAPISFLRFAV